ncbi:MAG: DUF2288 domain-containing protein [Gammaproteobacteria bacterium]|nr:DUF2288 domain-containing protein [Gammaproteobacteria bacterium]
MEDNIQNEHIDQLNNETGKLNWKELERHFARGAVIKVAIEIDLVNAAAMFAEDNKVLVESWLASGQVVRANEDDARRWGKNQQVFWAIVTAPWVLVQEIVEQ